MEMRNGVAYPRYSAQHRTPLSSCQRLNQKYPLAVVFADALSPRTLIFPSESRRRADTAPARSPAQSAPSSTIRSRSPPISLLTERAEGSFPWSRESLRFLQTKSLGDELGPLFADCFDRR